MKNLLYLLAVAALSSCSTAPKNPQTVVIPTPTGVQGLQKATPQTAMVSQAKSNLIFNPPHGQPGHNCAIAVGAPLNQTAPVQANPNPVQQPVQVNQTVQVNNPTLIVQNEKGAKLNPAHGQPNHRCDIPVGAPLNSKPTQIAQTSQSQPVIAQATTRNGVKINPPHGQPNHRCDIAVGAPLNSKSTQAAVQPAVVPAADNKVSLEAQNGQKLNPKHGEPGHRCDLAVGAPLT